MGGEGDDVEVRDVGVDEEGSVSDGFVVKFSVARWACEGMDNSDIREGKGSRCGFVTASR